MYCFVMIIYIHIDPFFFTTNTTIILSKHNTPSKDQTHQHLNDPGCGNVHEYLYEDRSHKSHS